MTTAKNSLGRSTGRKFNAAAIKREFKAIQAAKEKRAESFEERWEAARIKRISSPDFGKVSIFAA